MERWLETGSCSNARLDNRCVEVSSEDSDDSEVVSEIRREELAENDSKKTYRVEERSPAWKIRTPGSSLRVPQGFRDVQEGFREGF